MRGISARCRSRHAEANAAALVQRADPFLRRPADSHGTGRTDGWARTPPPTPTFGPRTRSLGGGQPVSGTTVIGSQDIASGKAPTRRTTAQEPLAGLDRLYDCSRACIAVPRGDGHPVQRTHGTRLGALGRRPFGERAFTAARRVASSGDLRVTCGQPGSRSEAKPPANPWSRQPSEAF